MDTLLKSLEDMDRLLAECKPENSPQFLETLQFLATLLEDSVENMTTRWLVFYLPANLVDRLDAYTERLNAKKPAMRVSRVDVVRYLLTSSLQRVEKMTSI